MSITLRPVCDNCQYVLKEFKIVKNNTDIFTITGASATTQFITFSPSRCPGCNAIFDSVVAPDYIVNNK